MRRELAPWVVRGMGLAVGACVVLGLVALGLAAGHVLVLLFVAILLASALEPFIGIVRGRLPLGRPATILLVFAVFFAAVVGLALIVVPAAINQGGRALGTLPSFLQQAREWAETLRPNALSTSVRALVDAAGDVLTPPPPDPQTVVRAGLTVAEVVVSVATLLTIVFFWLVEHAQLQRYLLSFVPVERRAGARDTWNEIEGRLGMWVRGQLILMGAIGISTAIAYTLLGVPAALLLALIAAVAEAIPIVGPLLGAVPAVLMALTVSPQLALVVLGVYVVLQFLEGNVLVPIVMRNTVGISPLLVLISLLIGGAVGGLAGALLAVPVAATLEIVLARFQDREVPVAQDPAAVEAPDEEAAGELRRSLPDASTSSASK
ncbi:MAG: AI-2E family transporter [Chloroflexota bacterium]